MVRTAMSAAEWIATSSHLATRAGRIAYRVQGDGPALVLLHGFPTWSYDWEEVIPALASDHRVVTLDFPGYGVSEKLGRVDFSVAASADAVEALMQDLGLTRAALVIHDYGGIVGQELLDRRRRGRLSFEIDAVHVLNCGIVYAAYRPTWGQKLLAKPLLGRLVASRLGRDKLHAGVNGLRGDRKLSDTEFGEFWLGMSRDGGHRLAHRHIGYNKERAIHHARWEDALFGYDGPLKLIWGMADPVSGSRVLDAARRRLKPSARVVPLEGIGHFPQSEAPDRVVAAIRGFPT